MCDETVLLHYAKALQRELWHEAEMARQASLARACSTPRQARQVPVWRQVWRLWGGRVEQLEAPVTEHATA